MTLSELASIGSLVSSVAVVITLVFLLIQTRQNTAALVRGEANATQAQASAFRLAIINNREVARLLTVGLAADGNLDEIDEMRLQQLLSEIVWFSQHIWDRQQRGLLPKGGWERGTELFTDLLTSRRGAAWWDHNNSGFPPAFRADVDKVLDAKRHRVAAS